MSPSAAFVSFRFGPTDGVSVVARTWAGILAEMGVDTVTVTAPAREGAAAPDRAVPGLGLDHPPQGPPDLDPARLRADLSDALADVDLVVVENLLTIPLNLAASRALAEVLSGRRAVLHHHDPPWHRARWAGITELPATDPAWHHVAINGILRDELALRGIDARVVYNAFPEPTWAGPEDRARVRREVRDSVGFGERERVVAHPVRAIERKNLPAAIRLAEDVGATYWLLGPAEEGYGDRLAELLRGARCRVVHHPWADADGIYAAADHIAFPSTWEGFGNPPVEAALHGRDVTVGDYPVAAELRRLGFDWFGPGDHDGVARALADPDAPEVTERLDRNRSIARRHFSLDRLRGELAELLADVGLLPGAGRADADGRPPPPTATDPAGGTTPSHGAGWSS